MTAIIMNRPPPPIRYWNNGFFFSPRGCGYSDSVCFEHFCWNMFPKMFSIFSQSKTVIDVCVHNQSISERNSNKKGTAINLQRHSLPHSTNLWHSKLKLITSPLLLPLQKLYTKCTLVNSSFVNVTGIWSNTSVQQNTTTPAVTHTWTDIWLWRWQLTTISLNFIRVYSLLNSINVLINLQLMLGHMP